jgi:hypothetical protein
MLMLLSSPLCLAGEDRSAIVTVLMLGATWLRRRLRVLSLEV